jgi:hypothetical protein
MHEDADHRPPANPGKAQSRSYFNFNTVVDELSWHAKSPPGYRRVATEVGAFGEALESDDLGKDAARMVALADVMRPLREALTA